MAKARGQDGQAAALMLALAEQLSARSDASPSDRLTTEALAAITLSLHNRRPTDPGIPARVAALRRVLARR